MGIVRGSRPSKNTAILIITALLGLAPSFECTELEDLNLGSSLNVFKRFGELFVTMRVTSDGMEDVYFREPTEKTLGPMLTPPIRDNGQDIVFPSYFHMEFADHASELVRAYLQGFKIEMVERPWSAFTALVWNKYYCAAWLGLKMRYFGDGYSYIMIKLSRPRSKATITPSQRQQLRLLDQFEEAIIPGNMSAMQNFFYHIGGTHYIDSYTTGDALYQVFAYRKSVYKRIKDRLQAKGVKSISTDEFVNYFSPWYASHTGEIMSASGNFTVVAWITKQLELRSYSLVHVYTDPALHQAVDDRLGDEAMLQLDLRSLGPTIADKQRRKWFTENLDNQLKMWENTIGTECFEPRRKPFEYWYRGADNRATIEDYQLGSTCVVWGQDCKV